MKRLFRFLRAPLLAFALFGAGVVFYEPAMLSAVVPVGVIPLTQYGGAPDSFFLDSGCGKGGASKFEACGISPCEEPRVLHAAPLNDGLPIVRCLVNTLPQTPKKGTAIAVGHFGPGPSWMMFYAQKGDRFVPAHSYEELVEEIGALDSVDKAKVYLTGVLGYNVPYFSTSVTDTGKDYFVKNLYSGGKGKCEYLTRYDGRLGKNGTFRQNYYSRVTIKSPDGGCPTD